MGLLLALDQASGGVGLVAAGLEGVGGRVAQADRVRPRSDLLRFILLCYFVREITIPLMLNIVPVHNQPVISTHVIHAPHIILHSAASTNHCCNFIHTSRSRDSRSR